MDEFSLRFDTLTIGHNPDGARLASAFFSEDDIGTIIRCHFEVERAAIRSLDVMTEQRWKTMRIQYLSDKLKLLEVIGAPPKLLAPARTLNNQRNEFAHKGADTISEQQALDLLRGVQAFLPKFKDDHRVIFRGKHQFDKAFKECSIRQRYAATAGILVMLVAGIPEMVAAYRQEVQVRSNTL